MSSQWANLDLDCAKAASDITRIEGKDSEKILIEAISCLALQGPYATSLYLGKKAKKKPDDPEKFAHHIAERCRGLISATLAVAENNAKSLGGAIKSVSNDLEKLLLCRRLMNQLLTYALYENRAVTKE